LRVTRDPGCDNIDVRRPADAFTLFRVMAGVDPAIGCGHARPMPAPSMQAPGLESGL